MPPQRRMDGEMLSAMKTFSCGDEDSQSTTIPQRLAALSGRRQTAGLLHSMTMSLNQSDYETEKALYRQCLRIFTGQAGQNEENNGCKSDKHLAKNECELSTSRSSISALTSNGSICDFHDCKSRLQDSIENEFESGDNFEDSISQFPDMQTDTLQDPAYSTKAVISQEQLPQQTLSFTGSVRNSEEGKRQIRRESMSEDAASVKSNALTDMSSLRPYSSMSSVLTSFSLIDRINHAQKRCSSLRCDMATVSAQCDILLSQLQAVCAQFTSGLGIAHHQHPSYTSFKTSHCQSQEKIDTLQSKVPLKFQMSLAYLQAGVNISNDKHLKHLSQQDHLLMTSVESSQDVMRGVSDRLGVPPEALKTKTTSVDTDTPRGLCNTNDIDSDVQQMAVGTGMLITSSLMLLTPPCSDESAFSDQDSLQESKESSSALSTHDADSEGECGHRDDIPSTSSTCSRAAVGAVTNLNLSTKSRGPEMSSPNADQKFLGCSIIYDTPSSSDHSGSPLSSREIHLGIPGVWTQADVGVASGSEHSGRCSRSSSTSNSSDCQQCDESQHDAYDCCPASLPAITNANSGNERQSQDNCCDLKNEAGQNLIDKQDNCCETDFMTFPDLVSGDLDSIALNIEDNKQYAQAKLMPSKGDRSHNVGTLNRLQPVDKPEESYEKHNRWQVPTSFNILSNNSNKCDDKTHVLANKPSSEFTSRVISNCDAEEDRKDLSEHNDKRDFDWAKSSESGPKEIVNKMVSFSSAPRSTQTETRQNLQEPVRTVNCPDVTAVALKQGDSSSTRTLDIEQHYPHTAISKLGEPVCPTSTAVQKTDEGDYLSFNSPDTDTRVIAHTKTIEVSGKSNAEITHTKRDSDTTADVFRNDSRKSVFPLLNTQELVPATSLKLNSDKSNKILVSPTALTCDLCRNPLHEKRTSPKKRVREQRSFTPRQNLVVIDVPGPRSAQYTSHAEVIVHSNKGKGCGQGAEQSYNTLERMSCGFNFLRNTEPTNYTYLSELDLSETLGIAKSKCLIKIPYQTASESDDNVALKDRWTVKTQLASYIELFRCSSECSGDSSAVNSDMHVTSAYQSALSAFSTERSLSEDYWFSQHNSMKTQCNESVDQLKPWTLSEVETEPNDPSTSTHQRHGKTTCCASPSVLCDRKPSLYSADMVSAQTKLSQLNPVRLSETCNADVRSPLEPCYRPTEHQDFGWTSATAAKYCNMFTSTPLAPNDRAMMRSRCAAGAHSLFSHFPQNDPSCILDTSGSIHMTAPSACSFLQPSTLTEIDDDDRVVGASGKHGEDQTLRQSNVSVGDEHGEEECLNTATSKSGHAAASQYQPYPIIYATEDKPRPVDKLRQTAANQTYHVVGLHRQQETRRPFDSTLTHDAVYMSDCATDRKNQSRQMTHYIAADKLPPSQNVFSEVFSSADVAEQVSAEGFHRTYSVMPQSTQKKDLVEMESPRSVKDTAEKDPFQGGTRHQPAAKQFFKDAETGIELEGLQLNIGGKIYRLQQFYTDRKPVKERNHQKSGKQADVGEEDQPQEVKAKKPHGMNGHDRDTVHGKCDEGKNFVRNEVEGEEKPTTKPLLPTPAYRRASIPFYYPHPPCAHCLHHTMYADHPGPPCLCLSRLCTCAVDGGDACFERPHQPWWTTQPQPQPCGFLNRPYNGPVTLCSLHGGSATPFWPSHSQPAEHTKDSLYLPLHALSVLTPHTAQQNRLAFVTLY